MAENSKIEWTRHTWNPWLGCTQVSPACDDCYAMVLMDHWLHKVRWGAGEDRIRTGEHNWNQPKKWDRAAAAAGRIDTVFCLSLGDIWDNEVDPLWRRDAFAVMEATPNLLYLLLSKRIGNAIKMCDPAAGNRPLPQNAALGATMIDQDEWDRDLPKLEAAGRALGARFTFASVEPMLGPIKFSPCSACNHPGDVLLWPCPYCKGRRFEAPDWVIVGGESGRSPRHMEPDWARGVRDQCAAHGVAYFFKQMTGKKPIPDDLMVRQFPAATGKTT